MIFTTTTRPQLGFCKLCWHNFEHNRKALASENYAGIIGRIYELPKYVAGSEGVSSNVDKLGWWKKHEMDIPHWSGARKIVLVILQFSVAAERLFSLLTNSFGDR